MSRSTVDGRPSTVLAVAGLVVIAALGCGKKGDPQPPLARAPNAVSNLAVEQEGDDVVLTFGFPDRLLTGAPLTDLSAIEIYRVMRPSPALTAPRRAAPPPSSAATVGTGAVTLPGTGERQVATNVRLAEEAFYQAAERIASLPLWEIADRTRGASVVYRDPLAPIFAKEGKPQPLAYAVISVRRSGERSPLSNIVTIEPDVAPEAPTLQPALNAEGSVCLEWQAPAEDVLGRPVDVLGYNVYRRTLPQEEYGPPLNAKPVEGLSYTDPTAPYGPPLVYTVRAILAKNPKVEGVAAEEIAVVHRDVYPPGAPARLDALSEGNRVRLVWTPVDAADLAGYIVYRSEAGAAPVRLTPDPVVEPFFTDESVGQGKRYAYTVRAVDRAGNQSPPSPEAVAEPF